MYVPEPSPEETYQILLGLRERYEAHHKLRYTDEALDAAAKYSHQYISDRCFSHCCTADCSRVPKRDVFERPPLRHSCFF